MWRLFLRFSDLREQIRRKKRARVVRQKLDNNVTTPRGRKFGLIALHSARHYRSNSFAIDSLLASPCAGGVLANFSAAGLRAAISISLRSSPRGARTSKRACSRRGVARKRSWDTKSRAFDEFFFVRVRKLTNLFQSGLFRIHDFSGHVARARARGASQCAICDTLTLMSCHYT